MKPAIIDYICCFQCGGTFEINATSECEVQLSKKELAIIKSTSRNIENYEREILEGSLKCKKCASEYPIIRGVPRVYKEANRDFKTDIESSLRENKDEGHVQKTFSREWDDFNYDDATIWLWDVDHRIETFCEEIDIKSPEELAGKTMVDAGCGSSILSMNLSHKYQIEIVALDMSHVLDRAFDHNKSNLLHYVQGSVLSPPLKPAIADQTYSHGVFHHTSSTVKAFEEVAKVTKPGAKMYIWLYGKKRGWNRFRFLFIRSIRFFIARMPQFLQTIAVWIMGSIHGVVRIFKRLVGFKPVAYKSLNQYLVGIRDKYTPKYAREHTESEVKGWFEKAGYIDVVRRTDWPKTPFWKGSTDLAIRGVKSKK